MPGQRQRGQPQPRRPPLGPLHQRRHLRQFHPGGGEQLPRLGHGEPQIRLADLGQPALQPQPVQAQPHVMPGGQHEPQVRRGPHDQQLQLPQRVRTQLVHVVDHQPQPVIQRRQIRQQPLDDHPPVQVRRRRQFPYQRRPRRGLPQRGQHRQPEPLRIPLAAPGRHPRGAARHTRPADPGPQQHRLAAARRRRHHAYPGLRREPPEQPGTGHDTPRATTSGAAGNGARSGNGPHGSDHRTTPARMARCQLSVSRRARVPRSRVRARPTALSLALVLDHRLNDRRHRRFATPPTGKTKPDMRVHDARRLPCDRSA